MWSSLFEERWSVLPASLLVLLSATSVVVCGQNAADESAMRPETEHDHHVHAKDDLKHQQEHLRDVVGLSAAGKKHIIQHEYGEPASTLDLGRKAPSSTHEAMLHFFIQHDYDKSNTLDGIELSGALSSYYDYGMPAVPPKGTEGEGLSLEEKTAPLLLQEEVEAIVDRILQDHDLNGDGFLTFTELLANPDGIWSSLNMVDDIDEAYDYEGGEDAEYGHEDGGVPTGDLHNVS